MSANTSYVGIHVDDIRIGLGERQTERRKLSALAAELRKNNQQM
jgi:hypothetical protein